MRLRELQDEYHEQVQFLVIYIREAHPLDGWWLGGGPVGLALRLSGSKAAIDLYDPKTMEERSQVARSCEDSLRYNIPTLVDDMDDSVNQAYAAMPTRLYLVAVDGRVAYAGGLGPFGFKPGELKDAIDRLITEML